MSQESDQLPKVDSKGQQESVSQMDIEKMVEGVSNAMIAELKCENDRHNQSMTTVLTKAFKNLAITIQNPNVSKSETPETAELNQNYSQNMSEVVTPATEKLNQSCSKNKAGKAFYDTSGKRGLLFILQFEDSQFWDQGNANDLKVLNEFFKATLGFDVRSYNTYSELDAELTQMSSTVHNFYCLMICISGHGDKNSVCIKLKNNGGVKEDWKTIDEIKERISNETISTLSGVPKIIILDTCRGSKFNKTAASTPLYIKTVPVPPTTDSDLLLIYATTQGHVSAIPETGSVGIQGVMKALKANWKNDHLEEMIIDARGEVAKFDATYKTIQVRQTLETQSTLTKRLKFVKLEK